MTEPTEVVLSVSSCARCQRAHESLTFTRIHNPIIASSYETLTHWALCPTLKQPVLMGYSDVAKLKLNATE